MARSYRFTSIRTVLAHRYWYSPATIDTLVAESLDVDGPVAFLSTPSVFFGIDPLVRSARGFLLLDYDTAFATKATDAHFAQYDFHAPARLDTSHHGRFAAVVIDPPFITEEVWRAYHESAVLLLRPGGRVLATTIAENAPLMSTLFGAKPQRWQPSIPHLVYQYACYTNYESKRLEQANPEVPE